ncbi:MAG TPA: hypothetical protein VM600_05310 [Actinomycetota bacterium]|nr:hypothetical protein [Actinomycetota bacterium]
MTERIDFSALTRAERIVLVSGVLTVVNGMIPWWYRYETARGSVTFNAGLQGWGVLAIGCGALAALGVLVRAWFWPSPAPARDGLAYATLGMAAIVALIVQALDARGEWLGLWAGITMAVALTAGGLQRRRDRARGWR